MRYEMRENSQGWDICDTEADVNFGDYFMNIDECVEKMNELDKELQSIKKQIRDKYRAGDGEARAADRRAEERKREDERGV